jgi:FkbH-like protein
MLTLCGTYTLDPVAEVIEYWADFLGIDVDLRLAPYAQLFPQLLDPASQLRRNQSGANAVLLRWIDLFPGRAHSPAARVAWSDLEARITEVASALKSFVHRVPCLVLVGPFDQQDPVLGRATARLQALLAGTSNLFVEPGEAVMRRYRVERAQDPVSDRFGHVPFTSQAIAALGTAVARWYAALVRPPVKVLAVDGDHTLWSGVVAEDGPDHVRIDAARTGLQRMLVEQHDGGRLVCMLSKNEKSDVRSVFERHPEMPLKWGHLVGHRVDWNPKPDNLRDLVSELGLALDSVVFLDDNPVECAEMRAHCAAVTTVRVPTDPAQLAAFADHLWLFDRAAATVEDRERARMYRENASRAELRRGADSLQAFLDSLELVVEIAAPSPADVARLAQLTQRTNQFNASLIRCSAHDVCGDGDDFQRLVRVRDRFGDYGVVGQVRAQVDGNCLAADLFMLSCRALGRGVEYRMLAALGAHAVASGLQDVAVLFRPAERNAPARRFLERVFDVRPLTDERWLRLPACVAARITFDASQVDGGADESAAAATGSVTAQRDPTTADAARPDIGSRYEYIAHVLTTGARIEQAIADRVRPRSDLASGFISPAPGLERTIATIWQEVLRIDRVGSLDRFQDLGGKSVQLVQVHRLLLDRLGVELDITTLFQHPTVASLAAHLGARAGSDAGETARQRGLKIREARARSGARFGMAR